ncbi:MAG: hypothetical protein K2W96_04270 [Gemmataceae bacterium]|nr:hypothetical protein [Gemmataceae bacterium]
MSFLLVAALLAADPEPTPKAVKPRELTGLTMNAAPAGPDKPWRLDGDERRLRAAIPDKATREALMKAADLKKEEVLVFSWTGSGGDRLVPAEGKAGEAAFTYTPGKSGDKARHLKFFAVPAKARVKVTRK